MVAAMGLVDGDGVARDIVWPAGLVDVVLNSMYTSQRSLGVAVAARNKRYC